MKELSYEEMALLLYISALRRFPEMDKEKTKEITLREKQMYKKN